MFRSVFKIYDLVVSGLYKDYINVFKCNSLIDFLLWPPTPTSGGFSPVKYED